MAASAFACTVRAASGQWAARSSIHAFTEGGTGAGWSGRLAWRLTGKKKKKRKEGDCYMRPEVCSEFSPGRPVFGRQHRRSPRFLDPREPGCPAVLASLPAPSHSAFPRKQSRRARVGGEEDRKVPPRLGSATHEL